MTGFQGCRPGADTGFCCRTNKGVETDLRHRFTLRRGGILATGEDERVGNEMTPLAATPLRL
jgi:hypothetical protein